jgi:hypothetical protein
MSGLDNYKIYKVGDISVVECHNNVDEVTGIKNKPINSNESKTKSKTKSNNFLTFKI